MNTTDLIQKPSSFSSLSDQLPGLVEFYLTLPQRAAQYETGNAAFLLDFIIKNALQARSVELWQEGDKPPLHVLNIRHEVLGWVYVQNRWAALAALADTFAAAGIASQAQLAWYNTDELIWHDHFPKPTPVPFALRLDAAKEWYSQSAKFGEHLKLIVKILADHLQAQKHQDEFVETAKDLLKSVEQAINQQPPLPPPQ